VRRRWRLRLKAILLIGMQLLRGYDLRIQTIEGGLVTIEALK
jgi:hypothetical protein